MTIRFPDRMYLGFAEWALDHREAEFLLGRGHALVDGAEQPVTLIARWPGFTQIRVGGTDALGHLRDPDRFLDSAVTGVAA